MAVMRNPARSPKVFWVSHNTQGLSNGLRRHAMAQEFVRPIIEEISGKFAGIGQLRADSEQQQQQQGSRSVRRCNPTPMEISDE